MSLDVAITKVSQDINLANGQTENFLLLELPNGSVVRAKVNEAAAQAVMGCFINGSESSHQVQQEDEVGAPRPVANGFHEITTPDGHNALEFGGTGAPTVRARPRYVGADAMGNPIVPNHDVGEIASGGDGADEDGVGQV